MIILICMLVFLASVVAEELVEDYRDMKEQDEDYNYDS